MAGFWPYFRDTLAWLLIRRLDLGLPGGRPCAQSGPGQGGHSWLRDQFHPATCEEAFVEWLAAARGIARHPLESMVQFRARVVKAYAWQLQGGGQEGLPSILSAYGYPGCTVENLREDDPELRAEFRVLAPITQQGAGFAERDSELLDWVIAEQKPARSKLALVRLQADLSASQGVASGRGAGELTTVWLRCPDGLEVRAGVSTTARLLGAEALTVAPGHHLGIAEGPGFAALCAAQSFDTVTVYPPDRYPEV